MADATNAELNTEGGAPSEGAVAAVAVPNKEEVEVALAGGAAVPAG